LISTLAERNILVPWSVAVIAKETLGMHHIYLAITYFAVTALVFASLIAFERMIGGLP
jgi:hypothetical protein